MELAEVDRRGELLRLRIGASSDVSGVIDRLQKLGFLGEVMPDAQVDIPRWYGTDSVGDLSREEADTIARRVVPAFARQHDIDASEGETLRELTTKALHQCLITYTLDATASVGPFHNSCGRAVENETRPMLGADRAAALGQAIEADLAERSAFKE